MTLNSDVRLGRLTTNTLQNPTKAKIVYGTLVHDGVPSVELLRIDPVISADRCGRASAEAPKGSKGLTYFVFDVMPGTYVASSPHSGQVERGQATFAVAPGKQLYIGDFTSKTSFTRDLEAAKAAFGPSAANLELAEMGEVEQPAILGFMCLPP